MPDRYRVVVDGFLAAEVAEFFAEQVKRNAPDSLKIEVQEWVEWRGEWVDPAAHKVALEDLPDDPV